MNTNTINQEYNNNWLYPQVPFTNSYQPFNLPQPFSTKRFAADEGGDKPEAVVMASPVITSMHEESLINRKRKAYFKITKNETAIEKKAVRAARNRIFAKESRDRKQLYIRDIENQLTALKQQLEVYKKRLSKYDLIEKHLEANNEAKGYLDAVREILADSKDALNNNEVFIASLKKLYVEREKSRHKALGVLTKAMIQILMPLPVKMLLWSKDKGVNIGDCDMLQRLLKESIPFANEECIKEYVGVLRVEEAKLGESAESAAASGLKIRTLVRKITKNQKKAQAELMKICNYMIKNVFPNYRLSGVNSFIKMTADLPLIPELNNYSLCHLTDSDFTISEK